ncbi:MAG: ketopantoate reductase family protein [Chloroflexi bacterium]|nr:ketopantoate reductase family protein [Chloroflexota bacterium]
MMRILVMGSGGVGGYFGGLLAKDGHDVVFVARGAHLEAMQSHGLELRDCGEITRLSPVTAVRLPSEAGGTFDLIMFAVKTYDMREAAQAIVPAVGPNTAVLPLQNGVDAVDEIGATVGMEHMLAGTTNIGARIVEPGVVERFSPFRVVKIGEPGGGLSERAEVIAATLRKAGVDDATAVPDAQRAIWEKFMFLASLASVTSVCNLPAGPVRAAPEGHQLWQAMMHEVLALGRATGVNLPDASAQSVEQFFMSLPEPYTTSLQRDFEGRRRVEVEHIAGTVVRRGRALGVPTPTFDVVYAILRTRALSFGGVS